MNELKRIVITIGISLPIAIIADCVKEIAYGDDISTFLTIISLVAGFCLGIAAYMISGKIVE